jgi:hypothetical protein
MKVIRTSQSELSAGTVFALLRFRARSQNRMQEREEKSAQKRESIEHIEKGRFRTFSSYCNITLESRYKSQKPLGSHILAVLF